jgi:hypothetical protein
MAKITMETELLADLLDRGFVLDTNGRLTYASGSISNYKKLVIGQPAPHCSLAENEEYIPACYVQYESFQEPGYIECDWKRTEEGFVAEKHLLDYVRDKGIMSASEIRQKREERRAQIIVKQFAC